MEQQNYRNHVRNHPPFHFIGMPLVLLTLIGSLVNIFISKFSFVSFVVLAGSLALGIAFALVRTYATKLQDRVIRMEENFRHYVLTGQPLNSTLTIRQITALRFASNEEFPGLCEKAAVENLSPNDIKKAVQNWKADFLRV